MDTNPQLYHAASSYYSMIARYALGLADVAFDSHLLDIHSKKEQLQDWYIAINPAMTVPAMLARDKRFDSSAAIVDFARTTNPDAWCESLAGQEQRTQIDHLCQLHDAYPIEQLTFDTLMTKNPLLRWVAPRMLKRVCEDLSKRLAVGDKHQAALQVKLDVNRNRLAYFASAPAKLRQARSLASATNLIAAFPGKPIDAWLFGELPSAADVRLVVLLARLKMIGVLDSVQASSDLLAWFDAKAKTPIFVAADIWTRFQLWRIVTHR